MMRDSRGAEDALVAAALDIAGNKKDSRGAEGAHVAAALDNDEAEPYDWLDAEAPPLKKRQQALQRIFRQPIRKKKKKKDKIEAAACMRVVVDLRMIL